MQIKFFQPLADIRNHYEDVIRNFDNPNYGLMLLETWGIQIKDKDAIREEYEVLRYLLACHLMLTRDRNVMKPSLEIVHRCFERHLTFLDTVHSCHAYTVNKHSSKKIQKQYKACRHYLFKFSLPAWYEKLPAEVLTFEEKYGKL